MLFSILVISMVAKIGKWSLISVLMMLLEISTCRKVLANMWSIAAAVVFVTLVGLLMNGKIICSKIKLTKFVTGELENLG